MVDTIGDSARTQDGFAKRLRHRAIPGDHASVPALRRQPFSDVHRDTALRC